MIQIFLKQYTGLFPYGHKPLLVSLAQHAQVTAVAVEADQRQFYQFRHPEPCGIQQVKHHMISGFKRLAVVQLFRNCQKSIHLINC